VPTATVDLREIVRRLADRRVGRTEANVQSDLHMLLTAAPFNLGDDDLDDIVLESPVGDRRRIDVEVGFTVFEVKRDLRAGKIKEKAIAQLEGYVSARTAALGQRYVGVLTDGADWYLYQPVQGIIEETSHFEVSSSSPPDVDGLCVWIEGVLATGAISPSPREIRARLGAVSPGHALDAIDLAALYAANRGTPTVALKRQLWAKLLTTALGTNFADTDALFVEHTLLVATAGIIGHAVVGYDPSDPTITPATLLSGLLFTHAQIGGVVEEDFFSWVIEVPGGESFIRSLARRLGRFSWRDVDHDVMKVLYESVIDADQRHRLGEYYTPDWLAEQIVTKVVTDPLSQRVLDPACGSGTFVFWAVRRYLEAAAAAGHSIGEAISGVTNQVLGVDIHPVATMFARVTYLLAIGAERLQSPERGAFAVPIYLGDSIQWGQEVSFLSSGGLTVATDDGAHLFARELVFPDRLLADAGTFDRLVTELADLAAGARSGSSKRPSLAATFRRFAVHPDDQQILSTTFEVMCDLHSEGRDHIWGYYARNLARPVWLAQEANRVDVLVGNPPWLAYRYMPAMTQATFRAMSTERGLWHGASVATHQDLSGLFVARAIQLYLRQRGRFGFVMPLATLSRRQFAGFRAGRFASTSIPTIVAFDVPWDLHQVKPSFFPVPASVVFGTRIEIDRFPIPVPTSHESWAGRLPAGNMSWDEAAPHITRNKPTGPDVPSTAAETSPYAARFAQGATVVPRVLFVVEPQPSRSVPLGTGAGRRAVRSVRSPNEKRPWRDLAALHGVVESQFVRPLYVGDTVLPYRVKEAPLAVIPWDGQLLDIDNDRLDSYPGLAEWWRNASALWLANRSSDRLSLADRLDYRHGLLQQLPATPHRVVYSASGMYLAAANVTDPRAVVEHNLYWAACASMDEARYLTAILNSDVLTLLVRPLQARGEHNPRHFDKYVFRIPIPVYNPADQGHNHLSELAAIAEQVAAQLDLPSISFQAQRRRIREALRIHGIGNDIENAVSRLLR
jgi:SAM-dependent methyltransferase